MPAINFNEIREHNGSKHDAFEEMVCQILRCTEAADNDTWVRLYGAGGDGGIEAYWIDDDNRKIGIQAKYFTRSSDIKWNQIVDSFRTALDVHPDLNHYRIYVACDLTGPTARGGQSGVERWNEVLANMREYANAKSLSVRITLHPASDIRNLLIHPKCLGIAIYWFGALEITSESLQRWIESAKFSLGVNGHDKMDINGHEKSPKRLRKVG